MSRTSLISQFKNVTGVDEAASKFYLDSSGWDLEMATRLFFESGGVPAEAASQDGKRPSSSSVLNLKDPGAPKLVGLEFDAMSYGEQLHTNFVELFNNPTFSDLVLLVHGERIPVHRIILSAWSAVFRKLLHENEDKRELEITLSQEEASLPVFKQLLQFMYTGCTDMSPEIARPLLELAHEFQVQTLKDKCGEYLFLSQTKKDIGELLALAEKYECKHLEKRCAQHLGERFDECLINDSLMNISVGTWEELLKRDEMKVNKEEDVFKAVMRYAASREDERLDILKRLLPLVRFGSMSNQFLVEEVEFNPELRELDFVHDLVHEAYRYKLYQTSGGYSARMRPRRGGLKWNVNMKSVTLELDEAQTSVKHLGPQGWASVCAESWFSTGVHRFEILVNSNVSNWIFIGVAARGWAGYQDTNEGYVGHYADSWSFGSYPGWGQAHNSQCHAYGCNFKTGDTVVATVNMDEKTLSFSVNGTDFGVCHKNIANEVCPVVTLYKKGDNITIKG